MISSVFLIVVLSFQFITRFKNKTDSYRLMAGSFNIGVLFTKSADWKGTVPFKKRKIRKAYAAFARRGFRQGMNVFFAQYKSYSNGILKRAWYWNGNWQRIRNQEIDFVYNRFNRAVFKNHKKISAVENLKYRIADEIGMLNHPMLEEFCWDKVLVSEIFQQHTPKTFLVNSIKGLNAVLPEIKSRKIVLKPRFGTLGSEVMIIKKNELPETIEKNTLVQEFINTSHGIKGLTKGMHDLRLIMINGKLNHAYIRIPERGMLVANMARGGKKIFVPNRTVPHSALKIAKGIDRLFRRFNPRLFSVDFLFDKNQKPYIVECNSSPTLHRYGYGKYKRTEFFDDIFAAIKSRIKMKVTAGLGY